MTRGRTRRCSCHPMSLTTMNGRTRRAYSRSNIRARPSLLLIVTVGALVVSRAVTTALPRIVPWVLPSRRPSSFPNDNGIWPSLQPLRENTQRACRSRQVAQRLIDVVTLRRVWCDEAVTVGEQLLGSFQGADRGPHRLADVTV